jgi:hypothetical protein
MPRNNPLMLLNVTDKVHAAHRRGGFEIGGRALQVRRAAAERTLSGT